MRIFHRSSALVIFLATAFTGTVASGSAQAAEISLLAGTNFTRFSYSYPSSTLTQSFRPGLAFGGIVNLPLWEIFEAETGLVFMLKRPDTFDPVVDSSNQLSSLRGLQIPLLLRVSPVEFISLGLGGYFTQGFDRIQKKAATTSSGEPGYGETGTNKADFGVLASLQVRVWLSYELRGIIDLRYLYGLTDVDTTGLNSKYFNDIQLMLGMTIGTFR